VAAFANASGGSIIVGAEIILSSLQAGEQIAALKPFPETLFNVDQYAKIIDEWLYPAPSGLVIKWCPDKDTHQSGIGVIFIPTQAPETKPFLLTRTSLRCEDGHDVSAPGIERRSRRDQFTAHFTAHRRNR